MSDEAVLTLICGAVVALFGLLSWLVKSMWTLLKKMVEESLAKLTGILERQEERQGQVIYQNEQILARLDAMDEVEPEVGRRNGKRK